MSSFLLAAGGVLAAVAVAVLVWIFVLDSVLWSRPSTWRAFVLRSQADADTTRALAYNQGFYNLFLAIGVLVGLALVRSTAPAGVALLASTVSMVLAALVLVTSNRGMRRAAAIQRALPLLGATAIALSFSV